MKEKIIFPLIITVILVVCGYIIYDKNIAEKENSSKVEPTIKLETPEKKADPKILALTAEQLNTYLNEINDGIGSSYLGQLIKYQDENLNLKLNTNLFGEFEVKNALASYMGSIELSTEEKGIGTFYYAPYDQFKKVYKTTWDEDINKNTHSIIDSQVYCYQVPFEPVVPFIQIQAKQIVYEEGIYIIKTTVGIFEDIATYNYNNNYEGQIRFEEVEDGYQIISYLIVEI